MKTTTKILIGTGAGLLFLGLCFLAVLAYTARSAREVYELDHTALKRQPVGSVKRLAAFSPDFHRSFFQLNLFTACFTGVWTIALAVGAQWLFLYYFSYSQPGYAFVHHYAPKYGYTLLFLPLLYLLNRALFQALRAPDRT